MFKNGIKKVRKCFWSTLAITGAWDNVSNEDISLFFCTTKLQLSIIIQSKVIQH